MWVEGRERGGGRNREERDKQRKEANGVVPVGSMMFSEVERRLDVLVFRACFATSVWQAKGLVQQGHVKLNGEVVSSSLAHCIRPPCRQRSMRANSIGHERKYSP
jgi:ribosomal protein S4